MDKEFIKSPLNYTGGKYKILDQIIPLFPEGIDTFVDLFAGGFNVGINVTAKKVIYNDIVDYLIDLFYKFRENDIEATLRHIKNRIKEFALSKTNEEGYKKLRDYYNKHRHPLDLYVLICYSFNYQIRFNNSHEYNNSFGRNRSSFNPRLEKRLAKFIKRLKKKKVEFKNQDFVNFDINALNKEDFVYCDPPYLISTGSYNDGKRGFKGWREKEERELLDLLNEFNNKNIKFALSNVLKHKGKTNNILSNWSKNYNVIDINKDYKNCNYQAKNNKECVTKEVLITNYEVKRSVLPGEQLKMSI
ncbi:DNA adenine methylase [Natroniella sp. ANB-PHB2]|uniref:DNA adenine methylase n=1 Tax=Natroniella sp. ANB-PHB2 TaxID=3384444 RepID=UPI0038D47A20